MNNSWGALTMRIPASLEEPLLEVLSHDALGSETRFDSPERCELRLYFADVAAAAARLPEGHAALRSHGLDPASARMRVLEVPDGRWAERWQESLRPFPLGRQFDVHPSGRPAEEREGRIPILLVPGRAFGTGEHGTTRLAVEALERHVTPGSRWLDLGTGTGLLALVARHLGAGTVVARDNDPEAVEVAREVLDANGATGTIRLELGSMDGLPAAGFDGVVANIVAPFFLEHAGAVVALLRPEGILLATGLLQEEAPAVSACLARAGLPVESRHDAPPWCLLAGRRPV
jgi:ribosomal protein L11 methyltransferase